MKEFSEDVKKQVKEIVDKYNKEVKEGTATEHLYQVLEKIEKITGPSVDEDINRPLTKEEIDNAFSKDFIEKFDLYNVFEDIDIIINESKEKESNLDIEEMIAEIDQKLKELDEKEND